MKKRLIIALTIIFTMLAISGCEKEEESSDSDLFVEVEYNTVQKTIYNDSDYEIMNISVTHPVIKNEKNLEALKKINDYYIEFAEGYISSIEAEEKEFAEEDFEVAKEDNREFMPHEYVSDIELRYNGKVLSFLNLQYMSTGGAHPNSIQEAQTFDTVTGEKLKLEDVMGVGFEEAKSIVLNKVLEEIRKSEGSDDFFYYESYEDDIKENFISDDYFITDQGICVFYQTYSIAPYVAGFPTFIISNQELGQNYILNK